MSGVSINSKYYLNYSGFSGIIWWPGKSEGIGCFIAFISSSHFSSFLVLYNSDNYVSS